MKSLTIGYIQWFDIDKNIKEVSSECLNCVEVG